MENEFSKIREHSNKFNKVQGLINYVNEATLIQEHRLQPKGKAVGIDGITKGKYQENLKKNIKKLMNSMRNFSYKPKAVRRVYIPKGNGKVRPLGIPSYEDKLVQGVMCKVLNNVYEDRFMDFSYGFRENRNCHQAIKVINETIMRKKVNYIVDADIKGFFDNISHEWLIKFLEHDIEDKRFIRYIKRFLYAGTMENMTFHESDKGTPQGGLISPVLANIYLHYVLDLWFEKRVKKQYKGEAYIVRYADDFICMFQYKNEAKQFYQELIERLKKFGLEIEEDKTKIMPFGRFARKNNINVETFDFLGFSFINGMTRTNKYRVLIRTSEKKLKIKRKSVKEWLKHNHQLTIDEIIDKLNKKMVGHYRYYGVSGNFQGITKFYRYVVRALYKMLSRRSQRRYLNWERYFKKLKRKPILKPKLYTSVW